MTRIRMAGGCTLWSAAFCTLALASPARALSGTVSGCAYFDDQRGQCCDGAAGCAHTTCGDANQPFKEARVALVAWWGEPGSGTTNSNGCFDFSWDDASCFGPTCSYTFRIFLQNPNDFRINNASGALYSASIPVTVGSGATAIGSLKPATAERWGLYAAVQQYFDRVVDQSSMLSASMTNFVVSYPMATTLSTDSSHIQVATGFANSRPFGVAHEMGHSTTHVGFGETVFDFQGCTNVHARWSIHTCERVAFNEGIATFWAMPWGWSKNSTDPVFEWDDHLEANTVDNICEGTANCDVENCVAA